RNFLRARKELFTLPLSYKEQRILGDQRLVSMETAPHTDMAAQLLVEGRRDEARKVLFENAIPGINHTLRNIQLTIDEYENNSTLLIDNITHDYEQNGQIFQLLALLLSVAGIVVIFITMTRLSRTEERTLKEALDKARAHAMEASENEQYLQAVMDNIGEGIVTIDCNGFITSFNSNAQRIFGYGKNQLVGSNISVLMPEADRKRHEMYTRNSKLTYTRIMGRDRNIIGQRSDGSQFPMEIHVAPIIRHNKEGFVGVMRDISERMEAEKSLRRAQKMEAVGQLTGGIAHDFNNILSIIFGNLYLLKRELSVDSTAYDLVTNVKQSSERGADLIKQLLGFSRNKIEQEVVSDINQLITDMGELIERSITPEIVVKNQFHEDLWKTRIDPGDFQDTLLNLVINARDSITGNGSITLETSNVKLDSDFCARHSIGIPGDYVMLEITDSGSGIPDDVQERIFDPFFTTKEVGKGTGLGLAMVYGFIQRSTGHILVDSTPGTGTSFKLYLPRSNELDEIAHTEKELSEIPPMGSETVLVVDDDKSLLETTCKLLHLQGYSVLTAGNGKQALEVLQNEPDIKLLFTDIVMPGDINGYQLVEKATTERPDLKVLLTTGYSKYTEDSVYKGDITNHKVNLLYKPYSLMELAQKLRKSLDDDKG
ncbi:MAG: PAS domain S-box protein, partial [Gammaproteobacteria bacterium]|nr:PAS domain S-box protein [Gammaproteobacteria bacterium]